ncbi:uncharacterized protein AMSG_05823 [Thecamonas trahens ATCC 50062]|uniref:KATNIP domain-containing protein n=1 Tax=Thecamonas trahens ATCC 50062 TaxID=461836 RepID=A0A0L0DCY8_THETB|nr:hypothetical protein AMSG_05823 [Thecamonas trahens ATCC 50062]KNC50060.1 hypothetical protein AMSG_05823 [Thecamonas trahens ATCC 50062]|eukprot:XP_013757225.1 hypothetical protein AMSG_05823 [Thecamonas trahens ATCC 50062]
MLRISLASPRPIAGLRIYNYNKSEEDSFRGVKTFELWLDDAPQVYAGEAYEWVVRKAGATGTEGGHLLELNPQLREAQLATGLGAECESGSGKNEASAWRRREPFVLPTVVGGLVVEIVLLSNWGDLYYMGMDALRGWSLSGEELDLEALCEEVVGTPPDINVLDGVSDDTRGAHNVVVPEEKRRAGMSWLVPWHPAGKAVPRLKLVFPAPVFFSCLELVNYSKTPMRGVRHFQLWVDGLLVYAGTVDAGGRHTIGRRPQAGGSGGPVPSPPSRARRALAEQAVVFTNDRVQVARGGSARSLRHPDAVRWNLKARAASKRPPTSQR